jgi:osmotically-inducible protein OsmY
MFDTKYSKQKIYVSSYNYRVLLYGDVQNLDIKNEVELITKQNSSVRHVINLLNVVSDIPVINLTIDKNIIETINKQLSSNVVFYSLKISVFNGNVYLQGVVTKSEGDSISQQISQIPNVKSVIRVFDILKEEDMKKIDSFGIK